MSTDFRALCAELVELSAPTDSISQLAERLQKLAELANRARAALAQPEPVATGGRWSEGVCGDGAAILRDGVMIPIEEVVQALNRTPAQPVPVVERLPGPEDCDADGRCWFWHPGHKEDDFIDGWILLDPKWAGSRRDSDDSLIYTHWLPHWALPVPTPANNTREANQ
jgi:hypothetical protein